jgi:copper chaperone CopZ
MHISDIHCPACIMRLESLEDELPGVRRIQGSYHKQKLDIEFDERQVTEEQIRAAIREIGYTPA